MISLLSNAGFCLILAALFFVGLGALVGPTKSAAMFGVPIESKSMIALVRAMGARDLAISGIGLLCFLEVPMAKNVAFILLVALFSGIDAALVYALKNGTRWKLHATGAGLLILFSVLLSRL